MKQGIRRHALRKTRYCNSSSNSHNIGRICWNNCPCPSFNVDKHDSQQLTLCNSTLRRRESRSHKKPSSVVRPSVPTNYVLQVWFFFSHQREAITRGRAINRCGDYFKCRSSEVVPYIFCSLIPFRHEIITSSNFTFFVLPSFTNSVTPPFGI